MKPMKLVSRRIVSTVLTSASVIALVATVAAGTKWL